MPILPTLRPVELLRIMDLVEEAGHPNRHNMLPLGTAVRKMVRSAVSRRLLCYRVLSVRSITRAILVQSAVLPARRAAPFTRSMPEDWQTGS